MNGLRFGGRGRAGTATYTATIQATTFDPHPLNNSIRFGDYLSTATYFLPPFSAVDPINPSINSATKLTEPDKSYRPHLNRPMINNDRNFLQNFSGRVKICPS